MEKIFTYDTTLRDGTQGEDVSFSAEDKVKIAKPAYDKISIYKGSSRNHMVMQVTGFRIGSKDAGRADDLLDCFCYGIALSLGNAEGF